jgi:hypothetical protein
MVNDLLEQERTIMAGGGAKAIARQHEKQRLTARERIGKLCDAGAFFELGLWAAWNMYQEWGGAPSAGVVTGIGLVAGRPVMIIANDATVKAGAFFPMTAKKVLRAQRIAMDNRLPLVYLVDSAGVFLPLQDEVFPEQRRDLRPGDSSVRRDHGQLRRRRRLSAGVVRQAADDRRQRPLPRRPRAGESRHRPNGQPRGARRRSHARCHQRDD